MTDSGERDEKSAEKSKDPSRSLRPGKRISTSIEMAILQLLGKNKRSIGKTVLTHEQITDRAYRLWQQRSNQTELEEEREPQANPSSNEKLEEIEKKKQEDTA